MKGADRRAGLAVVEIGRSTGRADILNAIREAGREKDVSTDCESETLYKLQDGPVKRGGQVHFADVKGNYSTHTCNCSQKMDDR